MGDQTEYTARYFIDHGCSCGFGEKYPDTIERTERFYADGNQEAHKKAMSLAGGFAEDYLSNPRTGLTTVFLLSLDSSVGPVPFNVSESVVKRSMLEHLLILASERVKK